mmetsp:Transcript_39340/g.77037  ORF Transcript_39340/g.77037 Transcript_39340/m.77037 type:complete len:228 (-) Transcript_39340:1180-1863(-)
MLYRSAPVMGNMKVEPLYSSRKWKMSRKEFANSMRCARPPTCITAPEEGLSLRRGLMQRKGRPLAACTIEARGSKTEAPVMLWGAMTINTSSSSAQLSAPTSPNDTLPSGFPKLKTSPVRRLTVSSTSKPSYISPGRDFQSIPSSTGRIPDSISGVPVKNPSPSGPWMQIFTLFSMTTAMRSASSLTSSSIVPTRKVSISGLISGGTHSIRILPRVSFISWSSSSAT